MENLKQEQRQEVLQQRIKFLTTESDEFLNWYVKTVETTKHIVFSKPTGIYYSESNGSSVYLPYTGHDEKFIFRLFGIYVSNFFPDFQIDITNEGPIRYLISIYAGTAPRRGLVLRGTVGVGKTATILVWLTFRKSILPGLRPDPGSREGTRKESISFHTPQDLARLYFDQKQMLFAVKHGDVLVLDDAGAMAEYSHFGAKINLLEEMIYSRYNQWKRDPSMEFYLSTNLLKEELNNAIGDRAFSRLLEMCEWNKGAFSGNSRRGDENKLSTWPTLKWHNPFNSY